MTDKTDLEKNLDSAIEKVGNDMYSFVSKPLLIECRDVLIENQSLTSRIEGLEKLLSFAKCADINCDNEGTIASLRGVDEWELEPCPWCHERQALLSNHNTGGGDDRRDS